MDGTVVTLDENRNIKKFLNKDQFNFCDINNYYKTVNIYKFSKKFSNSHYVPFLEAYSKALGNNEYYEQVLKVITIVDESEIKAAVLDNEAWYEIDDIQDLDIAESIFANSMDEKLYKIQKRYGGYWRYPKLLDFCYLVNPFYPTTKLLDEMKANFERLICDYPSGMEVNSLLVSKYFEVNNDQIVVGNGAAEIIKSLMGMINGKVGIIIPTFEEYVNRIDNENIVIFNVNNKNYSYSADDLIKFYDDKKINALLLINPDNPSGNYIKKESVLRISKWAEKKGINFIVDESFVDFVDIEDSSSLINKDVLESNSNLIVIKSISKSFGVPGLRLGILASNNLDVIKYIKKDVSIWNINSFAEFYLQIFEKYKNDYLDSINKFKEVKKEYIEKLSKINNLRVVPTQANYIMCEVTGCHTARELTSVLLNNNNIFIKDLSGKNGIKGEFIRVAIKRQDENEKLIEAIKKVLE
ncbi:aminotransferase class I/II-fold pyridoxal phosphate-dependent enzyme [Clostridium tertium]